MSDLPRSGTRPAPSAAIRARYRKAGIGKYPHAVVAQKLGVTAQRVKQVADALGVVTPDRKRRQQHKAAIRRAAVRGLTAKQAAAEIGLTHRAMYVAARRAGVTFAGADKGAARRRATREEVLCAIRAEGGHLERAGQALGYGKGVLRNRVSADRTLRKMVDALRAQLREEDAADLARMEAAGVGDVVLTDEGEGAIGEVWDGAVSVVLTSAPLGEVDEHGNQLYPVIFRRKRDVRFVRAGEP